MLRRILNSCVFLAVVLLVMGAGSIARADMPLAVLDLSRVMEKSSVGKDLISKLKAKSEALQKESQEAQKVLREKQNTLLKERKDLEANKSDDKVKAFEEKRKAFEAELKKADEKFSKKNASLQEMKLNALRTIQDNIAKISADIADEKKIQVVVDRKSVVIAQQGLDITDEVLKRLEDKIKTVELKASGS